MLPAEGQCLTNTDFLQEPYLGLLQCLSWYLTPPPQVREHSDHFVQADHWPWMGRGPCSPNFTHWPCRHHWGKNMRHVCCQKPPGKGQGDADTCTGTGKTSLLASGRRQDTLTELLCWLCCMNSGLVCSDRVHFEKLTSREKGRLSPADALCAVEVKGSDEIPPRSRVSQSRNMTTEPPWTIRNNAASRAIWIVHSRRTSF